MKNYRIALIAALAAVSVSVVVGSVAEAKRLGSGSSMGAQRQSVAPRPPAAPPGAAAQPVMPAQPGAALPAKPATPAAAAPAASGMSKWLGQIAGIAAGLGLAALLSHFGLPEGLGSLLLVALLAVAVVFVVRMLLARRQQPRPAMQYAGGAEPRVAPGAFVPAPIESAAPAPASSPSASPTGTPAWGSERKPEPPAGTQAALFAKPLPPGFDAAGFAEQAKAQFRRLQAAYDTADRKTLADVMTPAMFAEASRELAARLDHRPTEVVALNAEVLEVATEGGQHWASVRYTGAVREDGEPADKPLDEVWNLTKPVDGSSGWLLAGIQQTA